LNRDIYHEYLQVLDHAECLFSAERVARAVVELARAVSIDFVDRDPLVLCVMTGGLRFCSDLLGHLNFPLELDYLQLSRYRDQTKGGELNWLHQPAGGLRGRHLLVVDDILDQGITLASVRQYCRDAGALSVATAVLVDKQLPQRAVDSEYTAMHAPDRYLFGEGMDYKGYGRNLRGIYAIADPHP